jgi:hypothetical protein
METAIVETRDESAKSLPFRIHCRFTIPSHDEALVAPEGMFQILRLYRCLEGQLLDDAACDMSHM